MVDALRHLARLEREQDNIGVAEDSLREALAILKANEALAWQKEHRPYSRCLQP
jgi:hypothetical protein